MIGEELVDWRNRNDYTQERLQTELGLKSRGTLSEWENNRRPISRTTELALIALEKHPELRNTTGKAETKRGYSEYNKRFGEKLNAPVKK